MSPGALSLDASGQTFVHAAAGSHYEQENGNWILTECLEDGRSGQTFSISDQPSTIGRIPPALMVINSVGVSKQHASMWIENGHPVVRDLGSTNGTFVNGRRIETAVLKDNDLLQFANAVFRVQLAPVVESMNVTVEGQALSFAESVLEMEQLLRGEGAIPNYQPIIDLRTGRTIGHELLARSSYPQLSSPLAMFHTAARLGQECQLSELMRHLGARTVLGHSECGNLFVNTHPKEVINDRFIASLHELRAEAGDLPITVEVHEAAVADRTAMIRLRHVLNDCNMQLAYDDFGAGQARLHELSEVPPDYLKFDIKLIRGIDQAGDRRQMVVASLVRMAQQLGILTLAEGVETEGEAAACRTIGFELAQGYLFGRPSPKFAR